MERTCPHDVEHHDPETPAPAAGSWTTRASPHCELIHVTATYTVATVTMIRHRRAVCDQLRMAVRTVRLTSSATFSKSLYIFLKTFPSSEIYGATLSQI